MNDSDDNKPQNIIEDVPETSTYPHAFIYVESLIESLRIPNRIERRREIDDIAHLRKMIRSAQFEKQQESRISFIQQHAHLFELLVKEHFDMILRHEETKCLLESFYSIDSRIELDGEETIIIEHAERRTIIEFSCSLALPPASCSRLLPAPKTRHDIDEAEFVLVFDDTNNEMDLDDIDLSELSTEQREKLDASMNAPTKSPARDSARKNNRKTLLRVASNCMLLVFAFILASLAFIAAPTPEAGEKDAIEYLASCDEIGLTLPETIDEALMRVSQNAFTLTALESISKSATSNTARSIVAFRTDENGKNVEETKVNLEPDLALGNASNVQSLGALSSSLASFSDADVGFMLVDLDSGRGFCDNIDSYIYSASTFKIAVAVCALQAADENGAASIGLSRTSLESLVSSSLVYSDNSAHDRLFSAVRGSTLNAWLDNVGITENILEGAYARYTVRQATAIWLGVRDFLENGKSDSVKLIEDSIGSTEMSFIKKGVTSDVDSGTVLVEYADGSMIEIEDASRTAKAISSSIKIKDADDGIVYIYDIDSNSIVENESYDDDDNDDLLETVETIRATNDRRAFVESLLSGTLPYSTWPNAPITDNVVIQNKAGWIAEGGKYNSTSDIALVTIDDREYLLCILSSEPYSDRAVRQVSSLAKSALECRWLLVDDSLFTH